MESLKQQHTLTVQKNRTTDEHEDNCSGFIMSEDNDNNNNSDCPL